MKRIYIGIDPGLSGALAVIDEKGKLLFCDDSPVIAVKKGKSTKHEFVIPQMIQMLKAAKEVCSDCRLAIEAVHSMPGQGVASMFNMGKGFGYWEASIVSQEIPYTRVEPMVWKKKMGIPSGSDKSVSILIALRLFPTASLERKKDHGRAEAILIAEYLRKSCEEKQR